MIGHNPEVKEKLESLGIPVMVERSSYERASARKTGVDPVIWSFVWKEQEADAFMKNNKK